MAAGFRQTDFLKPDFDSDIPIFPLHSGPADSNPGQVQALLSENEDYLITNSFSGRIPALVVTTVALPFNSDPP